jgi:sugar fermentation stimulation protein A
MDFPTPLARGRLVRRYKRFLADIVLDDGAEITAHCPNPGAMIGLNTPGLTCWLSKSPDAKRKLPYTWELVEAPGPDGKFLAVGLNTQHPNPLTAEALADGVIPELAGYAQVRREVRYGAASRVDFVLEGPDRPACFLEVKGVTLHRGGGLAEFPDCVTARGLRHLDELAREARAGRRAVLLFVIQRTDCDAFDAAADLDPAYAAKLRDAARHGVEVLCYGCDIEVTGVRLGRRLPWRSGMLEQIDD